MGFMMTTYPVTFVNPVTFANPATSVSPAPLLAAR